jgi:glycosyltransferase involved in cell wall biosynthesis
MRHFYFWQNMISMHQSAFLRALAEHEHCKVSLIVEENLSPEREKMGWKIPDMGKATVVSFDDVPDWKAVFNKEPSIKSVHVFSGINAYPRIHEVFLYAMKQDCSIGIMAEPLNDAGAKGKLRLLSAWYKRLRFGSKIDFFLAISQKAYSQYTSVGYTDRQVFQWSYCVEDSEISIGTMMKQNDGVPFRIMFVGSMILRKGYDILVKALQLLPAKEWKADFYCVGNAVEKEAALAIERESGLSGKIRFLPFLDNASVRQKMYEYDVMILPSRFDGWGAVINEALTEGTPVIVSHQSGASTLVSCNPDTGDICRTSDANHLASIIARRINHGRWPDEKRKLLKQWASENISGKVLAAYFLEIMNYRTNNLAAKPAAPWCSSPKNKANDYPD